MTRQDKIERKAKAIKITKRVLFIITILVVGYGASIFYSLFQTDVEYENIVFTANYDHNMTPEFTDDTYDFSITVPLTNHGFYAFGAINYSISLIVPTCPGLDPNTVVGSAQGSYPGLAAGTYASWNIPLELTSNATILQALIDHNPDYEFQFSFAVKVHWFTIYFNGQLPTS